MSEQHREHRGSVGDANLERLKHNTSFWQVTLWSLIGPLVWSLHLALIYGVQHVWCALGGPASAVHWFVLIVTVILLAVLLPFARRSPPHFYPVYKSDWPTSTQQFLFAVMRGLTLLSMVGIVWGCVGIFFFPECGVIR